MSYKEMKVRILILVYIMYFKMTTDIILYHNQIFYNNSEPFNHSICVIV